MRVIAEISRRKLLRLLAVLAILTTPLRAGGTDDIDPGPDLLELLWTGTDSERLEVARDLSDWDPDIDTPGDEADARRRLRRVLDAEPDPFIRFVALDDLAEYGSDDWTGPLFVELLREGRTVDLWPALVWLAEWPEDGALEPLRSLWPARDRPWLQPLLIRALGMQGAAELRAELEGLARKQGPRHLEPAGAAVEALLELADPDSIPVLIEIARQGGPHAAAAAAGLGLWPDHHLVAPALIALAAHPEQDVRRAALMRLWLIEGDASLQARLRVAADATEPVALRRIALQALSGESDPLVLDLLSRLLLAPSAADELLSWEALSLLGELAGNDDAALQLMASLPEARRRVNVFYACGLGGGDEDRRTEGEQLRVTPMEGDSVRCWDGPGRPHPFEDGYSLPDGYIPRLAAGAAVHIEGVYEQGETVYAQVAAENCWLPMELLSWRELDAAESEKPWHWRLGAETSLLEFDIPLEEADSGSALLLAELGLLSFLDPGPGVIGVSLAPDVAFAGHRDLLQRLAETGDAPLFFEGLVVALRGMRPEKGMDTPPGE